MQTSEAVLILKNSEEQVYLDNAKKHLQAEELDLAQRELDKVEHRAQDKLTLVIQLERVREDAEKRARAAEEARVALIAEQMQAAAKAEIEREEKRKAEEAAAAKKAEEEAAAKKA